MKVILKEFGTAIYEHIVTPVPRLGYYMLMVFILFSSYLDHKERCVLAQMDKQIIETLNSNVDLTADAHILIKENRNAINDQNSTDVFITDLVDRTIGKFSTDSVIYETIYYIPVTDSIVTCEE